MSHARSAALCFAALTLFVPAMHAGPVTFVAAGAGQLNSTLSGIVVIDTTTGVVQSLNLTVSNPTNSNGLPITVDLFDSFGSGLVGGTTYFIQGDNSGFGTFPFVDLGLPVTTLVGYTGGSLCTPCGNFGSGFGLSQGVQPLFNSGSLTAAPEPASVALMGGALLGLAAWQRRRRSSPIR
jgi:hypothetical protein